jgi:hypothetical protein
VADPPPVVDQTDAAFVSIAGSSKVVKLLESAYADSLAAPRGRPRVRLMGGPEGFSMQEPSSRSAPGEIPPSLWQGVNAALELFVSSPTRRE